MSDNHLCKEKRIDEAIEEFQQNIELPFGCTISDEASQMAIKALDEIQKYQSLGTVEECRAALEKQEKIKEVIENANQWSKEDVFVKAQAFCDIEKIGVNSNEKQKS